MYNTIICPNRVHILFEKIPHVRSIAIGIWIKSGSRHETLQTSGISHFIEHMLFKGTQSRTSLEIADIMDGIGGQVNAFTTKECTCLYAKVLDTHSLLAADVLCDMFFNSTFAEENMEPEKSVIKEEIDMYEDEPEDVCVETLISGIYAPASLSYPILGTKENVDAFTGQQLKDYKEAAYKSDSIVISISGNFGQELIEYFREKFSRVKSRGVLESGQAVYKKTLSVSRRDIEQNHICVGFEGVSYKSDDRYTMQLLNSALGEGMSSRLFQSIREKQGLCYSIYSFASTYEDTGVLGIYTALNNSTEQKALELIRSECEEIIRNGITQRELNRSREQIKANILMSAENTNSRMSHLARSQLLLGHVPDYEQICQKLDAVTAEDIKNLAGRIIKFENASISAVGREVDRSLYERLFS